MKNYSEYDAMGLADLISSKQVSPKEVLEAAIGEIERTNGIINAVVTKYYGRAQKSIDEGLPDGPLRGVPFLLKDLRASDAGVRTTFGSRFFSDHIPKFDSEMVKRYKASGLVILGKTNTPEFGGAPTTENSFFGPTLNPWNLSRSAGGSSGGSAAAVAAGMVPAAHGSDGGGSIRIPAGCCGLFGFKPSRGVNPSGPDLGEAWNGLSTEHVITRTVRDSALLLDVTSGPSSGDPYSAPHFEYSFLESVKKSPKSLRIAVQVSSMGGIDPHDECQESIRSAIKILEGLGHIVYEARPSYDTAAAGAAFRLVIASNVYAQIQAYAKVTGRQPVESEFERINFRLAKEASLASSADFVAATWALHRVGRAVAPFFDEYDVLLTPTVSAPPPLIGELDITSEDVNAYLAKVFSWIPYTAMANQAGLPSMSVPLYWGKSGLPSGLCFTAARGSDLLLFKLASQLEKVAPWHDRRPLLSNQLGG